MLSKVLRVCVPALLLAAVPVYTAAAAAESGAVTDVRLWYASTYTEAGAPPVDWTAYKIIREKLHVNLILTPLPSSDSDQVLKINAAAAADSLPDLFFVQRSELPRLVKMGLVADVDDMYAMMPHRTSLFYDGMSRRITTIGGHSYGFAQPGAIERNEGVLIRKDWLDKLGLAVPVTTEDYFNVMKAFTTQDPDGDGKNDTWGYGAFLEQRLDEDGLGRRLNPVMGAFGVPGTFDLSKKSPGLMVHKPAFYDGLAYVKRMVDEKVIDPNWLAYKKDDFRAAWKQGKFGIMREQYAAFAFESNYGPFDKNFPDGEWIVADPPVGPAGFSSVGNYTVNYYIYAVSSGAEKNGKKAALARLLEWMSSDEGYYLLAYGVRDVNYRINEKGAAVTDGLQDPSKAYTKAENRPLIQLCNLVATHSDVELAARNPLWTTRNGRTMNSLAVLRQMQSKRWTPEIGAESMPAPPSDLERFYQQGIIEFVTGTRELTPANWKAWTAEFDKMGGAQWEKDCVTYATEHNLLVD